MHGLNQFMCVYVCLQEVDRSGSLSKNNFLPKSVSTPTGTKVTFPSNVRIISVPSGTNVVSSGGVGVNHTGLTQKIVSTTGTGATAQVNILTSKKKLEKT